MGASFGNWIVEPRLLSRHSRAKRSSGRSRWLPRENGHEMILQRLQLCRVFPVLVDQCEPEGRTTDERELEDHHPRASGERTESGLLGGQIAGSSPRERGTRHLRRPGHGRRRFIPARAGNAASICLRRASVTVHPRASGERPEPSSLTFGLLGSSPRERGTPRRAGAAQSDMRFIPARAGNASSATGCWRCSTVHPRASGERVNGLRAPANLDGSSPRERGTLPISIREDKTRRFIPARAGNAPIRQHMALSGAVHPRASGERDQQDRRTGLSDGSSPRERGTQGRSVLPHPRDRFIPARAGNAGPGRRRCARRAVHPRASGERWAGKADPSGEVGSSPRERGTHVTRGLQRGPHRFIPARAGNARP